MPHLNQLNAKLEPVAIKSLAFSHFNRLPVFTLSSHWLMMTLTFILIGCGDDFAFVYDTRLKTAPFRYDYILKTIRFT